MTTLFSLLFFGSLILLIIGLISPKTGLFWCKSERNRKKVFLVYGFSTLIFFIGVGIFVPKNDSKTNLTAELTEQTEEAEEAEKFEPTNKNVIEWIEKSDKKKQKYIKKNIEGKWLQVLQLTMFSD